MHVFFVPVLNTIITRYGRHSIKGFGLFCAIYLIPQFVLMYFFSMSDWWLWVMSIVLVLNLYEIGYIQNDTETIKFESNPTLRYNPEELSFYERHKLIIYGWRTFLGLVLSFLFLYFANFNSYMRVTIIVLWLLLPIYLLYNSIRNGWNFCLLTVLTSYRFIMPTFLSVTQLGWLGGIYLYALYPLPAFLQELVMGKFGINVPFVKKYILSDFSNRYFFRIKYYSILTFACILLYSLHYVEWKYLLLPLYYLLLRICLFYVQRRGMI